jgi:hypothetical protein
MTHVIAVQEPKVELTSFWYLMAFLLAVITWAAVR